MKKLLLLFWLFSHFSFGQSSDLSFTTKYYDAVDKWVALDKADNDSVCLVGFIYIDEDAGITLDIESNFIIKSNGLELLPNEIEGRVKHRLSGDKMVVAILSEEQIKQLGLPEKPDWLKYYKDNEKENSYLLKVGLIYNSVGASHNAFEPLLTVYEKDPHFSGLEFELAYAYNATKQFDKAIAVLNKAIENDSANFWFYRELGFSYLNQNKLDEAEKIYLQGIELSEEKAQKAEMAFNMTQAYFKIKNKDKFEEWTELTKKNTEENSPFNQYISYFEENWDK